MAHAFSEKQTGDDAKNRKRSEKKPTLSLRVRHKSGRKKPEGRSDKTAKNAVKHARKNTRAAKNRTADAHHESADKTADFIPFLFHNRSLFPDFRTKAGLFVFFM